jgi:acyl-CoA synthetase (AMP-forming)/AMP-acid ligase II/aryl carrier-like protein
MRELRLHARDRVGFSQEEMWPTLLAGATLVPPFRRQPFNPAAWIKWVKSQRLTVAALPTTCWHEVVPLLAHDRRFKAAKLRLLLVGGSRISPRALSEWQSATANRVCLLDRYLLAETAGAAAFCEPCATDDSCTAVSVFRPAPNTRLYLLDSRLQPVPIGVPGDLYVGGASLASGYTAGSGSENAAFVADPIVPGERLLKTGDCGRFLARGGIELVARSEDLARTSGYRLELSEICSVLYRHPAVRDVFVVPREEEGRKHLVAYLLSHTSPPPLPEEIRAFAVEHLPRYMVPSAFVVLKAFPLTPRGFIDRDQLPMPYLNREDLEQAVVAPRTIPEQRLANIWCELLGLKQVGVRENFFAVGGDSLMAIRLASRIKREMDFDLPARALFQHPTIENWPWFSPARDPSSKLLN